MKLLLDTHIWLWSLLEPENLSGRVVKELQDPENEIWLSPISTWEVLLLSAKGRIMLDDAPEVWISKALQMVPMSEAPITHEVAMQTPWVGLSHRDPADHFLVATAKVFDLTLVTTDERLLGAKKISVLPNR